MISVVVDALLRCGDERAFQAVECYLRNGAYDASVKSVVIEALIKRSGERGFKAVRQYLLDGNPEIGSAAAVIVAMLNSGNEQASEAVQGYLLSKTRDVGDIQSVVLRMLKSDDKLGVQAVRKYLGSETQASRVEAISRSVAAEMGTDYAIELLIEPAEYGRRDDAAVKALFSLGRAALNHITGKINDPKLLLHRSNLIRLLGESGDSQAFDVLTRYLAGDSVITAIKALGALGDARATSVFRQKLLSERFPSHIDEIFRAVARIKTPESVNLIEEFMPRLAPSGRAAAIEALETIGDAHSVACLQGALRSGDPGSRLRAAASLIKLSQTVERTELLDLFVGFIDAFKDRVGIVHSVGEEFKSWHPTYGEVFGVPWS